MGLRTQRDLLHLRRIGGGGGAALMLEPTLSPTSSKALPTTKAGRATAEESTRSSATPGMCPQCRPFYSTALTQAQLSQTGLPRVIPHLQHLERLGIPPIPATHSRSKAAQWWVELQLGSGILSDRLASCPGCPSSAEKGSNAFMRSSS